MLSLLLCVYCVHVLKKNITYKLGGKDIGVWDSGSEREHREECGSG